MPGINADNPNNQNGEAEQQQQQEQLELDNIDPNMVIYDPIDGFPVPAMDYVIKLEDMPFRLIPGEGPTFACHTADGSAMVLTNYRLHVASHMDLPLGLVEEVKSEDNFIVLLCKDGRSYRVVLPEQASAGAWVDKLAKAVGPPKQMEDVFALTHYAWTQDEEEESKLEDVAVPSIEDEFARMKFDLQGCWRLSEANRDYKLCATYPQKFIAPAAVTDENLKDIAKYRSKGRIPAVVWRQMQTGAVLARCSQPKYGISGQRSAVDEEYMKTLLDACKEDVMNFVGATRNSQNVEFMRNNGERTGNNDRLVGFGASRNVPVKKVLILDARCYSAAQANRGRGGGLEFEDYYECCDVEYMNIYNIHDVRRSFESLRHHISSLHDEKLDVTWWLFYLSDVLRAAVRCSRALEDEKRPVVVHCSDGWDRTAQMTSLAQVLLDSYYRTVEGFEVLVEKEWLSFGHKMADRNGNPMVAHANERSPIFLQFLDSVYQIQRQFPKAFEFNSNYLEQLARHTYSNLFGTFLCNSEKERNERKLKIRTKSVWAYLRQDEANYNSSYKEEADVGFLRPKTDVKHLKIWRDVYCSKDDSASPMTFTSMLGKLYGQVAGSVNYVLSWSYGNDNKQPKNESENEDTKRPKAEAENIQNVENDQESSGTNKDQQADEESSFEDIENPVEEDLADMSTCETRGSSASSITMEDDRETNNLNATDDSSEEVEATGVKPTHGADTCKQDNVQGANASNVDLSECLNEDKENVTYDEYSAAKEPASGDQDTTGLKANVLQPRPQN